MNDEYWNKKWQGKKTKSVNFFAKRTFAFLKDKKVKKILDLGCGLGQDSLYFADKGWDVTAVDASGEALKRVKENKEIKCIKKDLRNIDFPKNSFDVVYAHLSLHYFSDKDTDKVFHKIYKILKPGGYFFIKCKSVDDKLYGIGEEVGPDIFKKEHIRHFFSKDYMKEKLEKFKIIKIRKNSGIYHSYKSSYIEAIAQK